MLSVPGHFGFHFCHPLQVKLASLASYNVKPCDCLPVFAGLLVSLASHTLCHLFHSCHPLQVLLASLASFNVKPCDCLPIFAGFTQLLGVFAVVQTDVSCGNESSVFTAALGRHKTHFFRNAYYYISAKGKSWVLVGELSLPSHP